MARMESGLTCLDSRQCKEVNFNFLENVKTLRDMHHLLTSLGLTKRSKTNTISLTLRTKYFEALCVQWRNNDRRRTKEVWRKQGRMIELLIKVVQVKTVLR